MYLSKIIFNLDKKGLNTLLKALFGDIQRDSTSTDDNSKSHPLYLMDTYTGYDSHSDNNITINGLAKLLHFRSYAEAKGDVAEVVMEELKKFPYSRKQGGNSMSYVGMLFCKIIEGGQAFSTPLVALILNGKKVI